MRSLTPVAGLCASLALMLGSVPAGAQVYQPPINTPPPGYNQPPPPAAAPARPDYQPYAGPHYVRYQHRYYHHYYYRHGGYAYAGCHRRNGRIGAVAGAVGGGIIGAAITHGNPAFTMIGAGAGALTGHALGRNSRC